MTKETMSDLNTQTLIGYTDKRGTAWHYRAALQGDEPNHYAGGIPVEDVYRRLLHWEALEGSVESTVLTEEGAWRLTDPDRKTIVRSDTGTILGVFKTGYQIHQYREWLVHSVERLLDADLAIGSAGLLRGGAVAWVQIEMEDTLHVEGVDFRPFLTAATSLDGSLATTYKTGVQAVVCDNTLSAALGGEGGMFKVKHSSRSLGRLSSARQALGIVHSVGQDFAAQVEELTAMTVTDREWFRFLDAYVPTKDADGQPKTGRALTLAETKRGALSNLWNLDERVASWKGNAYGVLSAVNTWQHHVQNPRGRDRATRNMEHAILGKTAAEDRRAMAKLAAVL